MPVDWATVKMNLGAARSKRIAGGRKENIEESIEYYDECVNFLAWGNEGRLGQCENEFGQCME